ncbi:MAG: hypothetical protein RIQ71_1647 [Verrucomicrobiota bacterium]|jgi:arylsulfatase A-like enzyme
MKRILHLLLGLCAAGVLHAAESSTSKPNVLFIVVDDLRPELGCYGKDYIKSPNIDALAKNGTVFERAYCQQSVCSPSRTSVMTGMRPDTTKVWDLNTHFRVAQPDVATLGQTFKKSGYFVQGMGKIYHGKLDDVPTWSVPWQTPKAPKYVLPESLEIEKKAEAAAGAKVAEGEGKSSKANSRGPAYECADVPDNTYQDGKVADLAVETLKELAKKDQPFFLAVGFVKPHLPFVSPKKYWDMYDPAEVKLATNRYVAKDSPEYAVNPNDGEIRAYSGIPPTGDMPEDLARKLRHAYYAGVSYTDAQIGRVMEELKTLGLDKNTIVVLWGDHGWNLGEHSLWGKHTNVENDVNAPLIISSPGQKAAGQSTPALAEFVDIYPTLCDLAGVPAPDNLEGVSLKPLMDNPALSWKTAAFSQYPRKSDGQALMGYTMRTDRYRFTVWVDRVDHTKVDAVELYDHQTDPQENTNVAKDPANAELVKSLMKQWESGWQGAKPPAQKSEAAAG